MSGTAPFSSVRWAAYDGLCGVYVVGFDRFVKIGFSRRVGWRLTALEQHLPLPLKVYTISVGGTVADERLLHSHFRRLRLEGEWFMLASPLIEFVEERKNWISKVWSAQALRDSSWDDVDAYVERGCPPRHAGGAA